MVILEKPYVSPYLARTLLDARAPVLDTPMARQALGPSAPLLSAEAFARKADGAGARLYSNSENAIGRLEGLGLDEAARATGLLKDKAAFRRLLAPSRPDYFFREAAYAELTDLDPAELHFPLVVKPSVGFFSLGVHVVERAEDWPETVAAIGRERAAMRAQYPEAVLDADRYILEARIDGPELAVDAYFDSEGAPVIVNILAHMFAGPEDVSDRVYVTSRTVMETWLAPVRVFLQDLGARAGLKDFPVHAELRADPELGLTPIEVNPLRFAGWCCTDVAEHAWGLNPYRVFLQGQRPDWGQVLDAARERAGDAVTAIVVADLPPDLDRERITGVDYDRFAAAFSDLLELRRMDYTAYSVMAFAFVQVPEGELGELEAMLGQDMRKYLHIE